MMDGLIKKNRKRFNKVYIKIIAGLVLSKNIVKLLKSGFFMFRHLRIVKYNKLFYIEGLFSFNKIKLLLNKEEILQLMCLDIKTKIIQIDSFHVVRNIIKVVLIVVDKLYFKY